MQRTVLHSKISSIGFRSLLLLDNDGVVDLYLTCFPFVCAHMDMLAGPFIVIAIQDAMQPTP